MGFKSMLVSAGFLATIGLPCDAQIALSSGVVVITAPDGGEITGKVCNYTAEVCVEVVEENGTARVALSLDRGDLAGFSGILGDSRSDIVAVFSPQSNFDWLERAALVLAGALAGLIGNVAMALYSDKRNDHVEQRAKFRSWRDAILKKIKERSTDSSVKLVADFPDGLSKKTSAKIQELEAKLSSIENMLHAKPNQTEKLLEGAHKLVAGSSV